MEKSGKSPSGVKQAIAVPKESSSCGLGKEGKIGHKVRALDINQTPAGEDKEEEEEEEEEEEDSGDGENGTPRSKRLRLSEEQAKILQEAFRKNCILRHSEKEELAAKVKLTPRQVEVWFQNRRARIKLRRAKNECKLLKRSFKLLMDENQRLQNEMEELRALAVTAPPFTLTLCPQCKRVTPEPETPDTNLRL